jgi:hypothetical protein
MWQFDQNNPRPSDKSSSLTELQKSGPQESSSGLGSQAEKNASAVMEDSVSLGGVCLDEFFSESLLF